MRIPRLAWIAMVLAAACGEVPSSPPGPLDVVYKPTGLAVNHPAGGQARLIAASSNGDLLYDDATGGAVLSIDPEHATSTFGTHIPSFAGDLALADPAACGTAVTGTLAITATRGSNTLDVVRIDPDSISCVDCSVPLVGPFGDPLAVAVACGGDVARAFIGYLRTNEAGAWISQYDLATKEIQSGSIGTGPVRAFAYDAARERLYVIGLATGTPTPLRWVNLGGGCRIDIPPSSGGCTTGEATIPSQPAGLELRSMALANQPGAPQRAFLTGRLYDTAAAATAGTRTTDYGGVLLSVDLVDNAAGGVDVRIVHEEAIGRGAQDVRVLPPRSGQGDVVAALAVDDGTLWLYDDETLSVTRLGGLGGVGPELGHNPFGLAVDPEAAGTTARVYVGSFTDSFITPVDVPLDAPDTATIATTGRIGNTP